MASRSLHPFDRYYRVHGHYPRARVSVGTARSRKYIECTVTPTYLIIRMHPQSAHITIPRRQLVRIVKWLVPLIRVMATEREFDPEAAIEDDFEESQIEAREMRQFKKTLYRSPRRQR